MIRMNIAVFAVVSILLSGCATSPDNAVNIQLLQTASQSGFVIPESLAIDTSNNRVFVSNCNGDPQKSWVDDGDGFISTIDSGNKLLERKWIQSKPGEILNDPKSLAVFNGYLYICDNKRVLRIPLDKSSGVEEVKLGTTANFCDALAYDGNLYIGYGGPETIIFKISKDGSVSKIKGVKSINGIAGHKGKLYAVTWGSHEIYEIDPTGKTDPVSFGLAKNFMNLDGIDILDDGTFIVSDFTGKAIYGISADRKVVRKLAEVDSVADIVVDHKKQILYAPSYFKDKVVTFRIVKD